MKLLVTGDRHYSSRERIYRELDAINQKEGITLLVEGQAPGADRLAGEWAKENGIPLAEFPAPWIKYGRAAGVKRNSWMLDFMKPDLVLGFHKDISLSKGTANCLRQAEVRGITTKLIED